MLVMAEKFYATCQTRKLSNVSSIHVYQGIKAYNYKKGVIYNCKKKEQ